MKREDFQAEVLKELRNLNKTLKVIASNQERSSKITVIPHSVKNSQL